MIKHEVTRSEYPRPQMVRDAWTNLNGQWDFLFDFGVSGEERELYKTENFLALETKKINVPFCPESPLSGIEYKDFIPAVWYTREFDLTADNVSGKTIIHFGAVDYKMKLWINEKFAGEHVGGYSSFSFDITNFVTEGKNRITVSAVDDTRNERQPRGKQSALYHSHNCDYTRTTGIWQTVWLEFVPTEYIRSYKVYPNIDEKSVKIDVFAQGDSGRSISVKASFNGKTVGEAKCTLSSGCAYAVIPLSELYLWDVGSPNLYDLEITMNEDKITGYFGMRSVEIKPDALYLNGRPFFMRTVLDQGFNPWGIYTAPSDEFLRRDIELSMEAGFNGARLHQRVFEERTLYWADKLGYIVWGEYANNNYQADGRAIGDFLPEWMEVLERDFNHPSIIGWCINNETYWMRNADPICQKTIYDVTKRLDPTRPVIDAAGGIHFVTDMYDVHDYTQDATKLKEYLAPMLTNKDYVHNPIHQEQLRKNVYTGQPYWMSEYGGIFWNSELKPGEKGWGYGNKVKDLEEFAVRYESLTKVLLEHPRICGFCYTQLTDIEQEQNGLYKYDRRKKFPDEIYERIRKANTGEAAIEKKD